MEAVELLFQFRAENSSSGSRIFAANLRFCVSDFEFFPINLYTYELSI
jgi:hypothetical protein